MLAINSFFAGQLQPLLSFPLFDELFVDERIEAGRRDARRCSTGIWSSGAATLVTP